MKKTRTSQRNLKFFLLMFALVACQPVVGPGPNPPDVSWSVFNLAQNATQTFGQNGTIHLPGGSFWITFLAQSPGGLVSMRLTGTGKVECSADNGTGGIFTIGYRTIDLSPQSAIFNPTVASDSLGFIPFDFYKIDCHTAVDTDNGSKEALADKGTIILTGIATDTSGRTSTGQLEVVVP